MTPEILRWPPSIDGTAMSEAEILWRPSRERIAGSALTAFATAQGFDPTAYDAIHRWSVSHPAAFWAAVWDGATVIGTRGDTVVRRADDIRATRFFPDAHLNYAENLLERGAVGDLAIVSIREDETRRALTRGELRDLVSRCVNALHATGVGPGDRIAAIVTNDLETVALYLAAAAIGAVWASCSPDFGPQGAADRLGQIDPVVLVAVTSYRYAGKHFDVSASIREVAKTPSVRTVILLGNDEFELEKPAVRFADWIDPHPAGTIAYRRAGFDTPLAILFSSGTTGKPKGIVHRAGGVLLQHLKEHRLQCDIGPNDVLLYYTTCGWMMWNWLVSGLASAKAIVTFDGNPAHPGADRLPSIVDAEKITVLGVSARYIDSCRKGGLSPRRTHSLASLRTVLSTGSPLSAEGFRHIYDDWKSDLHLASISGGTDICASFMGGIPTLPVRAGELQGATLGMAVEVRSPDGQASPHGVAGELVCANAHPSMPIGFLNDADGSRYAAAYFERFPGVWAHGDWVEREPSGGYRVLGRSDATLNPGGVRIGTAEIYRVVERFPEIAEAAAIGLRADGDERIALFVRMHGHASLTPDLDARIRAAVRSDATPRHVPALIVEVPDLPRTKSGKLSELAIRNVLEGRSNANGEALANADCLRWFDAWGRALKS